MFVVELMIGAVAVRMVVRSGDIAGLGDAGGTEHSAQGARGGLGRFGRRRRWRRRLICGDCRSAHCNTEHQCRSNQLVSTLFHTFHTSYFEYCARPELQTRKPAVAAAPSHRPRGRTGVATPLVPRAEKCPSLRAPVLP